VYTDFERQKKEKKNVTLAGHREFIVFVHLDTVFHALIMSKIRYALCAWCGFLTQIQNGMINAFIRKMYKYHFVSACIDIDVIMTDTDRKLFKTSFSPACIPPLKSNPYDLRSRDHNLQSPDCNLNLRRNSFIVQCL